MNSRILSKPCCANSSRAARKRAADAVRRMALCVMLIGEGSGGVVRVMGSRSRGRHAVHIDALRGAQLAEAARLRHQPRPRASLGNAAIVQEMNAVGATHRGKAMRNEKNRRAATQPLDRF